MLLQQTTAEHCGKQAAVILTPCLVIFQPIPGHKALGLTSMQMPFPVNGLSTNNSRPKVVTRAYQAFMQMLHGTRRNDVKYLRPYVIACMMSTCSGHDVHAMTLVPGTYICLGTYALKANLQILPMHTYTHKSLLEHQAWPRPPIPSSIAQHSNFCQGMCWANAGPTCCSDSYGQLCLRV